MPANGNEVAVNGSEEKKMGFFDRVLAPPEWLNEKYMENVLREYFHDPQITVMTCLTG